MHSPATMPRPAGRVTQPRVFGREEQRHGAEDELAEEDEADCGEEDAGELHAHLEAPDEDVAAPREDVVEAIRTWSVRTT